MKNDKEEPSSSAEQKQAIDLISAVKEFHGFSSQELNKLLRDTENFIIQCHTEKGSPIKIDMEKVASFLPLHLIAVLISSDRDEALFRYILRGIRLMHSLCDLAPRHVKLEQILLDDVKVSEQLLDLVFYTLIVLGHYSQEYHNSSPILLMHSTLVACSLYLLTGCISTQWQDLVQVLLAHPKVDIFMDAAFGAVHVIVMFLQIKLSDQLTDEQVVNYICQQCEASLQFLQSLCQQKSFREHLLRNKELCGKGGVLFLAQSILKLNILPPFVESSTVVASVSRLKAKVLSILLHLCEAESISYLDEVASSPGSLDLAKSVALEVLDLLKTALIKDPKHPSSCSERTYPMGLLQLNAMRLADIFSDDSNFRSYITMCFTEVLSAIFSLSHGDFLLVWCSSEFPVREEDATVEYEPFAATGWVLDTVSSLNKSDATKVEFSLIPNSMPQASYAHQRTSLFVKIIANLHCFVPNICEEQERNLFLNKFLFCLRMDPSKVLPGFLFTSGAQKTATVCRNLRSLLSHAESLIPTFLNEEDVQLLRVFFKQLESLINSAGLEEDRVQGSKCEESLSCDKFSKLNINENHQSTGGSPSLLQRKEPPNLNNANSNLREEMSENSGFQAEEKFDVRSNLMDQGDDVMTQDSKEDKDKPGVPGGLREKDKDVQIVVSSGSDTSPTGGKNFVDQMDSGQFPKGNEPIKEIGFGGVQEIEKVEAVQGEEKQQRKRKRTIMNDNQISLIERALLDEPDMQRNTVSIRSWADKLSHYGSEVTSSQLKNWLNNRKARLARANKDTRAPLGADTSFPGKQVAGGQRQIHDSPGSPGEDHLQSNVRGTRSTFRQSPVPESSESKVGQHVVLLDGKREEVGKGIVNQVHGKWYGKELEESGTCVVDVVEFKADKWSMLPYPLEDTGSTFGETEEIPGVKKVLWDCNKMYHWRAR
ncbi:nodulin homeobox isoform X2 [Mangifera indica]|uniref:nodulin homeobox isoform X2 n=1 Tax=Mangifera indica TaxID=29780 RepID=UPI001CFC3ECF|nr:nodulin homeobox isoform X2 [Mangifera indica]